MDKESNLEQIIEEKVQKHGDKLSSEQKRAMRDALMSTIKEGALPYEAMNFDQEFLEHIYANAYQLFKAGHYDKAKGIFQLLLVLNPSDAKYSMGLATCCRQQKDFDEAIHFFFKTALLDKESPYPFYFAAECMVEKNDEASGIMALRLADERAKKNPQLKPLSEQITALIDNLTSKLNSKPKEELPFADIDSELVDEFFEKMMNKVFPEE